MNDLEIAKSVTMHPIHDIVEQIGLQDDDVDYHGKYKAKVHLGVLQRERRYKPSRLILVSAITPTPAGEGKTTVSIGLAQGLRKVGAHPCLALRQPSMGPVFGIKGGATGGGWSQVLPMEDINLHFTNDFHAITAAHNLLSAVLDNHIYQVGCGRIDPRRILWKRVLDMNDRALRNIVLGLGGKTQGVPRESGFDITAASEVMAILCLSEDLEDMQKRLGNILVAYSYDGSPTRARDFGVEGAMAALLKEAIKPNLVQSIEGVPAFIHGGPFANIAHGCNSVLATRMAMQFGDFAVTEAGFGFDLGAEKFFDIKCRQANLDTAAVVLVATVRALKMHGGVSLRHLESPNIEAVTKGLPNLAKHIENISVFGELPIVAVNRFSKDTDGEIQVILDFCRSRNVRAEVADIWEKGGEGGISLAKAVIETVEKTPHPFKPLYDLDQPVMEKIAMIAGKMYGAAAVDYLKNARRDLALINRHHYDQLPICMAKTQKSLSDNPDLLGRPKDFVVTVREILVAAGAGFLIPITGDIIRMPGLPKEPAAMNVCISNNGEIEGLF